MLPGASMTDYVEQRRSMDCFEQKEFLTALFTALAIFSRTTPDASRRLCLRCISLRARVERRLRG